MTDEQKRIVDALRDEAIMQHRLKDLSGIEIKGAGITAKQCDKAADIIEQLADELHHGAECMAMKDDLIDRMAKEYEFEKSVCHATQRDLEQVKRERDAMLVDMKT